MNFLFDATYLEASQGGTVGSYISIIGILLHFYFLWIVFSFKQELERTRAQPEVDALGMKAWIIKGKRVRITAMSSISYIFMHT